MLMNLELNKKNKIFKMKIKLKILNGSWTDDDVDLLPTIKLRASRKIYLNPTNKLLYIKGTSIALCWLKWGIMVSFGRNFKSE